MESFETLDAQKNRLQEQIKAAETQLQNLKKQMQNLEQQIAQSSNTTHPRATGRVAHQANPTPTTHAELNGSAWPPEENAKWPLYADEYRRYGRQLIMPEIGLPGQLRLKNARVLVVGVGGLGCPAAMYLAGAGVGTVGLMDGDTVELSNLHRQVVHSTSKVGMSKVDSACEYLRELNPRVVCNRHKFHLAPEKAISIFERYDLILDCTDQPTSRYLISDTCVLVGKPLVSASALRTDGQLIILNDPPRSPGDTSGGPCYRCIFPKPPPADSVLSCGEGGILGPVVGTMGVLQALEAIKLLCRASKNPPRDSINNENGPEQPKPSMLMFSAYNSPQFRTVRLRSRRANCAVCSSSPSITRHSLDSGSLDYIAFCGVAAPINILPASLRISPTDFSMLPGHEKKTVLDVRDKTQYAICALPNSVNVPWTGSADTWFHNAEQAGGLDDPSSAKYIVCRFGNDSQLAAQAIIDHSATPTIVKDIKGGFQSWREEVDPAWPEY